MLEAIFIFCTVWGIGATIVQMPEAPDRDRFDSFIKHRASMGTTDAEKIFAGQLPARSLYEYCFDTEDNSWKVCSANQRFIYLLLHVRCKFIMTLKCSPK